jgi:hypothetical protein
MAAAPVFPACESIPENELRKAFDPGPEFPCGVAEALMRGETPLPAVCEEPAFK